MASPGRARRYAEAIFELASRDGKVDEWRRELAVALELAENRDLVRTLDSPAVAWSKRRRVAERLLADRVSKPILNLVLLLVQRGRFSLVPAVAAEYDGLVRRSRGIVGVTVTTPSPLPPGELAALRPRIETLAASRVEIATATDPSLIGGLRVTIGDLQIDASVVGRLARLRKELVGGAG
jgi:F-type H+-transporting ATPase subunit delta